MFKFETILYIICMALIILIGWKSGGWQGAIFGGLILTAAVLLTIQFSRKMRL
ncbi:MAG: hypothetical protein Q8Q32_01740 [bacterium]|nr:hypothetical protein [bacterium]